MLTRKLWTTVNRSFSSIVDAQLTLKHLKDKPGIAEISLNRPEGKNSFNKSFIRSFQNVLDDIKSDDSIRAVVIRSLVPGVFSAGADLKERARLTQKEVISFVKELRETFQKVADLPTPVICAIDGVALGGGLELALASDIRIATADARLGLVETTLGIIPGAGGTQRLARLINPSLAKELIYTGRVLNGSEAFDIGLVNHVVKLGCYETAIAIAGGIVENGPVAIRMAKLAVNQGLDMDLEQGLKLEESLYAKIVPTKDRVEGLTAFQEKRKPIYTGN